MELFPHKPKTEKFIKEVLPNNQQVLMDMLIDHEKNKP